MAASRIFDYNRGILQTTDAGTATLDIPIPTNTVAGFSAIVVLKVDSTKVGGSIQLSGSIHNAAGTVALDNVVASISSALSASVALATAVITANSTNLRLTVTGVAAIGVIDWQYEIKTVVN